ncbi:ADP-ribosylglycohydrolase family protein [Sulfobacillus harzensis]|uniref:ADP-ribosylglycohydrolase n=1 Tax=Sulfobacillus harzensis TaxID=2729629 RepID=A0A7Y0Q4X3_9FIRM|nr:ADP-ribosylglycohydrolase family protein [Sulfobacillus harzensis]NMP24860.1 hypothetical protein [Sulfobacillus harzensis]
MAIDDVALHRRMWGCWWGQMAGDALGSQVEFATPDSLRRQFPQGVREMASSPTWGTAAGQLTDDTEMAIELLHVLNDCPETVDWDRVASGYVRWADSHPFDMGGTVRQAIAGAHGGPLSGMAERMRNSANYDSKANGALMRQSPLAIWGYAQDPRVLADLGRQDALLTHPNPVCQEASAVFVATVGMIIRWGLDAQAAYEFAVAFQRRFGQESEVLDALVQAEHQPPPYSHHIGYVLVALHNAFYRLLHDDSLEEVIVQSVMLGGDADTNAAIAGAVAGAVYGASDVPQRWIKTLKECHFETRVRPARYLPENANREMMRLMERLASPSDTTPCECLALADVPIEWAPWAAIVTFAVGSEPTSDVLMRLSPETDRIFQKWVAEGSLPDDVDFLQKVLGAVVSNRGFPDAWRDRFARAVLGAMREALLTKPPEPRPVFGPR